MKDGWIQMGSEEDADIGGEVKKEVGICEIYLKTNEYQGGGRK